MTYSKRYPGGLRLVVKRIEGVFSVSMGVLVGTGSCYETREENGISHFIEHMMFKGTDKRNAFAISDAMDRIGAQVNAFTSKEMTCYYAKSTTDRAGEAFEILSDLFLHSVFPEGEMDREKGVVCEEISMTEDTPDDLCLDVLAEAYYGAEGYGRTILGPSENVRSFTRGQLFDYVAERYVPANVVVSFAGNIEPSLAEELVERYMGEWASAGQTFRAREKKIGYVGADLCRSKDIEQAHIAFAYPSLPREDELADAALIVNTVLGGGMSSRLFQKVREEMGLAYTVYSYITSYTEGGLLTIYAGVNPANVVKAQDAIFTTVRSLCEQKLTADELERGRQQVRSALILGQENTATQMIAYGKYMLNNDRVFDFAERIAHIDGVTAEDCERALALHFSGDKIASAIIGKGKKPLSVPRI